MVGVNCFHGRRDRDEGEVREALDLDPDVPLMMGDMRERSVGRDLLLSLADHLIRTNSIT